MVLSAHARRLTEPQPALWTAAAFFLTLVTPFIAFLRFNEFGLLSSESLLLYLCLVSATLVLTIVCRRWPGLRSLLLAASVVVFIDAQVDPFTRLRWLAATLVAFWMLLALLSARGPKLITSVVGTILTASLFSGTATASGALAAPADRQDLPVILHIILDEHIGIEGFPLELASEGADLRASLARQGYTVFGGAYSQHQETQTSIAHLLNFESARYRDDLVKPGNNSFVWKLTKNEYFHSLLDKGYRIRVYQSNYLDLCPTQAPRLVCATYRYTSGEALRRAGISVTDRARLLAGLYLDRIKTYERILDVYDDIRRALDTGGSWLPQASYQQTLIAPVTAGEALFKLQQDVATARPGDVFVAHLLSSHFPYAYRANCQARPAVEWLRSDDASAQPGRKNSAHGRIRRYEAYVEQLRCVHQRLRGVLDAIPSSLRDQAVVVLHGDHGSRISERFSHADLEPPMTPVESADVFSTLFAVRMPGAKPAYDRAPMAIACLLRDVVAGGFSQAVPDWGCRQSPRAFLRDENGEIVSRPLRFNSDVAPIELRPTVDSAHTSRPSA